MTQSDLHRRITTLYRAVRLADPASGGGLALDMLLRRAESAFIEAGHSNDELVVLKREVDEDMAAEKAHQESHIPIVELALRLETLEKQVAVITSPAVRQSKLQRFDLLFVLLFLSATALTVFAVSYGSDTKVEVSVTYEVGQIIGGILGGGGIAVAGAAYAAGRQRER